MKNTIKIVNLSKFLQKGSIMYSLNDIAILYIDSLSVSYKNFNNVLNILEEPANIFNKKYQQKIADFLPANAVDRLNNLGQEKIEKFITDGLDKYGIFAVTIYSNLYPTNLKNIADPPMVLYTIGDTSLLKSQKIAIVGTRTPTNYGRDVANKFTKDLVESSLTTVSGLSYGIDTCVAVSTLEVKGKHIAVLAGGLDSIYPAQNIDLSRKISKNGLLVSEYRPGVKPRQYSFIARNRIISGLSDGTLVVEAGKKSGATSTAMFCIEQGRELFSVPGNITSPQSAGTNDLINEMPECFTISSGQILKRLNVNIKTQTQKKQTMQLDILSQQIVDLLSNGEMHFDDICIKTNQPANSCASTLTMLEILGLVKKLSGNFYQLVF